MQFHRNIIGTYPKFAVGDLRFQICFTALILSFGVRFMLKNIKKKIAHDIFLNVCKNYYKLLWLVS